MRGCRCPHHEHKRRSQRAWRLAHPAAQREALRRHRDNHIGCYCVNDDCPRVAIETAVAHGHPASAVMTRTGCSYQTYRAVLDRMSVAA